MTGSYNNFFKIFDRHSKREVMLEASKEIAKPRTVLKPRKVLISITIKMDQISSCKRSMLRYQYPPLPTDSSLNQLRFEREKNTLLIWFADKINLIFFFSIQCPLIQNSSYMQT